MTDQTTDSAPVEESPATPEPAPSAPESADPSPVDVRRVAPDGDPVAAFLPQPDVAPDTSGETLHEPVPDHVDDSKEPVLRNVSPLGDLDIPLVGYVVEAGATFPATVDQAYVLLEQDLNFEPVNTAAKKIRSDIETFEAARELVDQLITLGHQPAASDNKFVWTLFAERKGIDTDGMTKPAIVAAVTGTSEGM